MSAPRLLVASDDSDTGDLDLSSFRRKKFSNKARHVHSRCAFSCQLIQRLIILSVYVTLIYLAATSYRLTKKCDELSGNISNLILLPSRINILESDNHRLRMELDILREGDYSYTNQTRKTTEYVYDIIGRMTAEVHEMKAKLQKSSFMLDDVLQRLSTVESRCLNICQLSGRNTGNPRRRNTEKSISLNGEVIFRRTIN